jgi:TRAP-type uncharacterized transport system substrate-binding protein
VLGVHPRTGITSVAQIKEQQYPLRLSIRQNETHSTRFLVDQIFDFYDFSLADIESWGGSLQLVGPPSDPRRMQGMANGEVDAVFDEGIGSWLAGGLASGLRPLTFDADALRHLTDMGWRSAVIPAGVYDGLDEDHVCIDYSGWPLYTRADLPDETVYKVCAAFHARADVIPWDDRAYTGIDQIGRDTEATPLDVPLHPGAERWYREQW